MTDFFCGLPNSRKAQPIVKQHFTRTAEKFRFLRTIFLKLGNNQFSKRMRHATLTFKRFILSNRYGIPEQQMIKEQVCSSAG